MALETRAEGGRERRRGYSVLCAAVLVVESEFS